MPEGHLVTFYACELCPQGYRHERHKMPRAARHRLSDDRLPVVAVNASSVPSNDQELDATPSDRTHQSRRHDFLAVLSHRVSKCGFFYLEVWIWGLFPALRSLKAYPFPAKKPPNPFITIVWKDAQFGQVRFQL